MTVSLAVLIVEDSESDAKLVVRLLDKAGYKVTYKQVETSEQMRTALEKQAWNIVISDYSLPQFDGSAALKLLQETGLDIPFIVVSGTMGEETAVGMMKAGAHDYLVKGKLARLAPAVKRELSQAEERREHRKAEEELRRSRELLNQSFASLHDAIFIVEADTHKILDCNSATCEMFGYKRSEMLGHDTALLHVDKATLTNFRERLRQEVQERGFFHQSDFQMRRKDGTLFSTDQTVSPLWDGDDHKITGWVSTVRDITERKQAEEALRKSEQVLREAESLGHTGSWEQDLVTGKIFNTGENLRLFFGNEPDKGEPFEDYAQAVHPDDREYVLQRRTQLLEGGPGDIEYRVVWPDGSIHVIFGRATVVRDELGQAIRVYGTNVDITERKQAEEALHAASLYNRSLIEANLDPLVTIGPDGKIRDVNAATETVTGLSRTELINTDFLDYFTEPDKAQAGYKKVFKDGSVKDYPLEIQHRDGHTTSVLYNASLFREGNGKIAGVFAAAHDITKRKKAEEALRESESILRSFLEQSADAIMLADEQGMVIQWSRGAEKLTGYSREDSIGKPLWDVQIRSALDEYKSTEHYEYIKGSLQAVLQTGQGTILNRLIETPIQRPDGTHLITQTLAFPIQTHKGFLLGSILRDITESKQAEATIKSSEERFRTLYENNTIGLYRTTPDGRILLANPSLVRMLGYTSFDELSSINLEQQGLGPFYVRSQFRELIEKQGEVQGLESAWERKDGSTIFVRESARAIRDPDGKSLYYDGTIEDITDRKRAEEAVQKSESRYRSLFEDSPISLWEEDLSLIKQGLDNLREAGITNFDEYFSSHPEVVTEYAGLIKVLDINKATLKMFGAARKEDVLKNLSEIFEGLPIQVLKNELVNIAEGNSSFNWEAINKTLDGRLINIDMSWSVTPGYENSLSKVIISMIDITDRKQVEEALLESRQRYRALFEDTPVAIWEQDFSALKKHLDSLKQGGHTDLPGYFKAHPEAVIECAAMIRYLDVNNAALKLYRANSKEDLFENTQQVLSKAEQEHILEDLLTIAAGRTGNSWEGADETLTGEPIEISLNWSVAPGYEQDFSRVIVTTIDITERKRAEAALARSEQDYRTLFENMPTGLYRTSADGRILDANQALVNMFGYKDRRALLEANIVDLYVDPASDEMFKNEIEKNDIVTNFEAEFRRPDGTTFLTEDHNRIVRDEKGNPLFYEGSLIDITERKQAENMLVAERDLLNTLINTLPDNIFIKDTMGRILMNNIAHRRTLGVATLDQAVGKTDFDFFPREQAAPYDADEKQIIRSGQPLIDKIEPLFDKENNQRWLQTTKVPLRDRQGNIMGIVGFNHDITDRKRSEEALRTSEAQLSNAMQIARLGYWEYDVTADLFTFNDHFYSIFHTTAEQEGGYQMTSARYAERFVHPDDIALVGAEIQKALETTDPHFSQQLEHRIIRADGTPGYITVSIYVVKDDQGHTVRTFGANQDITERKVAEKRIQRQLEHLAALRSIDQVVISSFDLRISLTMILNQAARELSVDAADVLLLNSTNLYLEFTAGVGFRTKAAEKASIRLGQSFAGRVALDRQLIQIPDLKDQPEGMQSKAQWAGEGFMCYFGVPLVAKGVVRGVLEVYHRAPLQPDQEWLDFLNILADQAALAIDNANMFDNLQRSNIDLTLAYDATIEGWSRAMDLRDKETEGHTQRVTEMTMELAGLFGIKDEELVGIRRGALLHDIGKMGVPDAILLKPGLLTDEEWVSMRKHPTFAFEMLSPIHYLKSAIDIPYCHHEKWDGTGYPRGLIGEQIPLPARIFAIVDVWDAVTSDRPYRKAWSKEQAIEHLRSQAGSQFDPKIVQVCLEAGVFNRKDWNQTTGHD